MGKRSLLYSLSTLTKKKERRCEIGITMSSLIKKKKYQMDCLIKASFAY